jgi:hypothetical protein
MADTPMSCADPFIVQTVTALCAYWARNWPGGWTFTQCPVAGLHAGDRLPTSAAFR